jgi:hypothetical protein
MGTGALSSHNHNCTHLSGIPLSTFQPIEQKGYPEFSVGLEEYDHSILIGRKRMVFT